MPIHVSLSRRTPGISRTVAEIHWLLLILILLYLIFGGWRSEANRRSRRLFFYAALVMRSATPILPHRKAAEDRVETWR